MTIRVKVWLGAMASAALLVLAAGWLATTLGRWINAGALLLVIFAPLASLLDRIA